MADKNIPKTNCRLFRSVQDRRRKGEYVRPHVPLTLHMVVTEFRSLRGYRKYEASAYLPAGILCHSTAWYCQVVL